MPSSSFPHPGAITKFAFEDVNKAPTSAGVYAWYATLFAGAADWQKALGPDNVTDTGDQNLRNLLLFHSRKFNPLPYDVTAKSSFELTWKGKLEPDLSQFLERVLGPVQSVGSDEEAKKIHKLRGPFKRERTRSLLVDLLQIATPFLSAPIYIGTSKNLRQRLCEHTTQINKFANAIANNPAERIKVQEFVENYPANFAARVTALDLSPDQLEVYVLNVKAVSGGQQMNDEDLEALAAVVEWLLNRWHRPLTGRM